MCEQISYCLFADACAHVLQFPRLAMHCAAAYRNLPMLAVNSSADVVHSDLSGLQLVGLAAHIKLLYLNAVIVAVTSELPSQNATSGHDLSLLSNQCA